MATLSARLLGGLRCSPLSTNRTPPTKKVNLGMGRVVVSAVAISNAETKERERLKEMFQEAYERCHVEPMEGVSFTLDDFYAGLDKYDFNSEIGTKVKGTVFSTDNSGALVDITAKSSAFLPLEEACIYNIKHVSETGIVPGYQDEFVITGENQADDSLILSLRATQNNLAWERCRQLQAEDVVVKGKIIRANKGGVIVLVEGLLGFVPYPQISTKAAAEELLEKELPLKFLVVDEDEPNIVLSNRKAMAANQGQLAIGSVVLGTVHGLKPYGAFIDIGGISGLLHISQISHDRVSDIATVLQPGDTLKVMVLSHDRGRGRVTLSTKKLEPTPGDMIHNPKLVFEMAEEMAQTFKQRIAQAEAMARADMLRFQPESGLTLNSDGILGPHTTDLPTTGLDFSEIPYAENW